MADNFSKQKVLVLTSSYPKFPGDVNGNFVYELVRRLSDDFEIHVIAPAFKDASFFELVDGIRIHRHKQSFIDSAELAYGIGLFENLKRNKLKYLILPFYFLNQLVILKRVIQKEGIDIIHSHWLIPNTTIAVICKKVFRLNVKIISTIHGSDMWGFNGKIGTSFKRFTLKNIDSLTVVSNAIKERATELGYKRDIFVYPMGIDTNLFTPSKRDTQLRQRLSITGPFLLFVGIIVAQKGIRDLIHAMPYVIERFHDSKLIVIGDGDLKKEMIDLSLSLGISENVLFLGTLQHKELPAYFATADLFILPSYSEGWPVVVMEALSSGTKTIVTNISVFDKHEEKGKLFSIVPIKNSEAIADEIIKILNHGISSDIEDDLRVYAQKELDWEVISGKYKNLIFNTLTSR